MPRLFAMSLVLCALGSLALAGGCGTDRMSLSSTEPPPPAADGPVSASPPAKAVPVEAPAAEEMKRFAHGSNAFGFDLFRRLREDPGNLVVSPSSITTALAMTWGGARGETASQMQKVLHFEGSAQEVASTAGRLARFLEDPGRPITFRIANQLFGEKTYTFVPAFLESTKAAYGAPIELLDFRGAPEPSRQRVNAWIEEQTEKRIADLVPPGTIDFTARLVLVNAIYFLGDWEEPFDPTVTRRAAFHTTKTEKKDVPTMHHGGVRRFTHRDGVSVVELRYKGGSLSMVVVLPDRVDGLAAVEKSLDPAALDRLLASMQSQQVLVAIPKFEVKPPSLALKEHLQAMGMGIAFQEGKADFTGMADPPDPRDRLFIGKAFHKAFVRVDEKGTEAAAATAVIMESGAGAGPKFVEFTADHPFLFFIRDNASGLILFMGRVADPSVS